MRQTRAGHAWRAPLVGAAAALAMLLAGCGGGAGGSDDDKAARAISDSIMDQQDSGGAEMMQVDRKDADCVANGLVDEVGTADLQKYGMLTDDLEVGDSLGEVTMSKEDAEGAVDTLFDCVDVTEMMDKALAQGKSLDEKTRECLHKTLTEDAMRTMFVSIFEGHEDQATQALMQPMLQCAAAG